MITSDFYQPLTIIKNGDLLLTAEQEGYDLFVTTDPNLRYQQNLTDKQLAIIVLRSTSWPRIRLRIDDVQIAIAQIMPGDYREISI